MVIFRVVDIFLSDDEVIGMTIFVGNHVKSVFAAQLEWFDHT